MPQFSELEDVIIVEYNALENGCEMTFTQKIVMPHEEKWTGGDIEKALREFHDQSEQGWHYMFMGLKQFLETGKIHYPGS